MSTYKYKTIESVDSTLSTRDFYYSVFNSILDHKLNRLFFIPELAIIPDLQRLRDAPYKMEKVLLIEKDEDNNLIVSDVFLVGKRRFLVSLKYGEILFATDKGHCYYIKLSLEEKYRYLPKSLRYYSNQNVSKVFCSLRDLIDYVIGLEY